MILLILMLLRTDNLKGVTALVYGCLRQGRRSKPPGMEFRRPYKIRLLLLRPNKNQKAMVIYWVLDSWNTPLLAILGNCILHYP